MKTTKKAARLDQVAVRRETKTKELIAQLAGMLSAELGVKVKGPDAFKTAFKQTSVRTIMIVIERA